MKRKIEDELQIDALARAAIAVSKLREHAQKHGISKLSQKDMGVAILDCVVTL